MFKYIKCHLNLLKISCALNAVSARKLKKKMPPANKKKKLSNNENAESSTASSSASSLVQNNEFYEEFKTSRKEAAASIAAFKFDDSRVRILNDCPKVKKDSKAILYWMFRDQRVQDNWAFLFAQKLAARNHFPLHVCFCLLPNFLDANKRHYKFLIKGLQEVEAECQELSIPFHLLYGDAGTEVPKFVNKYKVGGVVCDFSPLRLPKQWLNNIMEKLPKDVTLVQVDAHNIVPVWEASDKQEYAARTIRGKIEKELDQYLTEFPPVDYHIYNTDEKIDKVDWSGCWKHVKIDDLDEVDWATPGYKGGILELEKFCKRKLKNYNTDRNDPVKDASSNLSPWLHFGQISPQRCALEVRKYKKKYKESVEAFLEELIIRRELSDNFCHYNEHYDSLKGVPNWAAETLNVHQNDKREHIYTLQEFRDAKTYDDLWNAAQIQLIREGKMHGFLRMYWAKKILEWTESPEQALKFAIYLNDYYSLDGRDPNGYVGCMWSIGGVHDQGWAERAIFGKVRFMNYAGCKRKFDVAAFVARYGGKVHKK